MSKKTIEVEQEYVDAWLASERRWARIAADLNAEDEGECPLCAMQNGCDGCPVDRITRGDGCSATPFDGFEDAPSHATAGAMLDWLKANRPRLKVKPKALTFADLEPGARFCFGLSSSERIYRRVRTGVILGHSHLSYLREKDWYVYCIDESGTSSPVTRVEPKK